VADWSSGQRRMPLGWVGQNSYGSIRQIWMLWYELSASNASRGLVSVLLHQSLNAWYMAMDGLVIQNAKRSVATAGICAHAVESNEYGMATLHRPRPHEFAATVQSEGVAHGGRAGMNLLTWMTVNSLACGWVC
jgi:hypothetical protein